MRAGPPDWVLSGVCLWGCRVTSWLGGTLLAASVPVASGRLTARAGQAVPEKLTMTVPRRSVEDGRVVDWLPGDNPIAPLARFGQELDVSIVVGSVVTTQTWTTRVARVLVTDWDEQDDGSVSVTAEGLARRLQDSSLTSPVQPTGTLVSEARRLVLPGMGVAVGAGLVDRACPPSMAWSASRLDALQEIADAWPALLRWDEWGQVTFTAPLPEVPTPVGTISDGDRGVLVRAPRSDTRGLGYNQVVARSSATGSEDVQAVAEQTTGPMSVAGPYGPVTLEWSSPLIETQAQAVAAARTRLATASVVSRTIPVQMGPDPRWWLDDPAQVVAGADTADERRWWGWVTGVDMPLTATDGAMRLDVGVSA